MLLGISLPRWKYLQSLQSVGLQDARFTLQHKTNLFIVYAHYLKAKGVADCSIYYKALAHDFRSLGYMDVAELLHSKPVMIARCFGARDNVRKRVNEKAANQKEANIRRNVAPYV